MSAFDAQSILDAQIDQPLIKRPPVPVGDYQGLIEDVKSRSWTSKDGLKTGLALDVSMVVTLPPEVQSELGIESNTLKFTDSIMLDLTAQGGIDNGVGKNRRLRIYREALDMNKPGDVFSPRKMIGQPLLVKMKHEIYEGEPIEKVASVAKA
jgi:hypothetical protein